LNVHHRRPGDHTQLVTLCAGCHARVHRSLILPALAAGDPRSSLARMASRCGRAAAASHRTVGRRTVGSGLANILGFSCANRRRPAPRGCVRRVRQTFSGFLPRSGAVPLRVGNLRRRPRGRVSDNTLAVAIRPRVRIGVRSPPSPSMPSAPHTPSSPTKSH
jgi:hypothetical protein